MMFYKRLSKKIKKDDQVNANGAAGNRTQVESELLFGTTTIHDDHYTTAP